MSVFATLRRKRDRTKGAAGNGTVLVAEAKAEPIFNSTPNLHKIHPVGGKPPSHASGYSSQHRKGNSGRGGAVFYPEDDEEVIVEDDNRYGGFGNRRSSSSSSTEVPHGGDRKFSLQGGKGKSSPASSGSGSLRHFASMISMFGSLKRTKSSKRMVYDSTQDLEPEKREATEFMRHRAAGRSRSPEPDILTSTRSGTSSITSFTDSESVMEDRRDQGGNNTEPGVRSSSSSDDDEIRRNYQMEHFKKVDKADEEHNYDYTTTKTELELKRTKIMIQGIKKFNMDPKKGIEFLVENDILQNTPDDVAKFLKFGEGLSKMAIGKYLGEHVDFNEEVLQAFIDLHNFKDLILVQALREFLWSLRLPGESQKIDRMMEAFAKRYCQLNPGIFSSTDTCYVLSFAIIMLNTTLHNPSVKDRITVERFIKMIRDVDGGESLNAGFLVRLYNSILAEPFKIPPEDANDLVLTFFNPNIEGWLWKQGGYKTWKRRWFILSNNCLYYFKFTTDKSPRGIIPLENVNAKEVSGSKSSDLFPFILYKRSSSSMPSDVIKTCKTLSNGTTVLSQYHTITVACLSQEDRKKWVQSINQNHSSSDFYDILTMKKRTLEDARQQNPKGNKNTHDAFASTVGRKDTPRKPVRKSQISQPSTTPGFEYKDTLAPELLVPEGPDKDPNNFFRYNNEYSCFSSISSGSGIEREDSSYGSYSDISRSRSESRVLDCTHDGSISSVEQHDTGSLGSRGTASSSSAPGVIHSSEGADLSPKDTRFDLSKKLSVIEESQNQSDRSSSSSGANIIQEEGGAGGNPISSLQSSNPRVLGYRKLSDEDSRRPFESKSSLTNHNPKGAYSDTIVINCDSPQVSLKKYSPLEDNFSYNSASASTSAPPGVNHETKELSPPVPKGPDGALGTTGDINNSQASTSIKFSRSGSIESDV